MAVESVIRYLLLPEVELVDARPAGPDGRWGTEFFGEKRSEFEVCPKCATPIPGRWDPAVQETTRTHGIPLPVV